MGKGWSIKLRSSASTETSQTKSREPYVEDEALSPELRLTKCHPKQTVTGDALSYNFDDDRHINTDEFSPPDLNLGALNSDSEADAPPVVRVKCSAGKQKTTPSRKRGISATAILNSPRAVRKIGAQHGDSMGRPKSRERRDRLEENESDKGEDNEMPLSLAEALPDLCAPKHSPAKLKRRKVLHADGQKNATPVAVSGDDEKTISRAPAPQPLFITTMKPRELCIKKQQKENEKMPDLSPEGVDDFCFTDQPTLPVMPSTSYDGIPFD